MPIYDWPGSAVVEKSKTVIKVTLFMRYFFCYPGDLCCIESTQNIIKYLLTIKFIPFTCVLLLIFSFSQNQQKKM